MVTRESCCSGELVVNNTVRLFGRAETRRSLVITGHLPSNITSMSYDLSLIDPVSRETVRLDHKHQMKGGNYALGGTYLAELNVTYNYWEHFRRVFNDERGIRTLYGKTGAESIPMLNAAIAQLKDDVDDNYWSATEGNAKRALLQLLALAQMRPDGVWDGD